MHQFRRVYDLLYFHRMDRYIYNRLIAHGANPVVAGNVTAVIYMLEYYMAMEVVSYLYKNFKNDCAFFRLTAEAESILDCLRGDLPPLKSGQAIPLISSLAAMPNIDLGYFNRHRHKIIADVVKAFAFGRYGKFFFDDALFATFRRYQAARDDAMQRDVGMPRMPPELETELPTIVDSVDERSLIINFLRTSPLTEQEITFYFQEQLGNCVERVEEMTATAEHLCRRIIFKKEGYVALVFNGQVEFHLVINGKQASVHRVE